MEKIGGEKMILQQGDVLLEKVEKIMGKETGSDERGYVLAQGEVTGHAHRITETTFVKMYRTDDGHTYLQVKKTVPLEHEEHKVLIIEPGEYEVRKVQEFDHFEQASKEVQD